LNLHLKHLLLALAVTTILIPAGCKKKAANPFPATDTISGWTKSSETRSFAAKDLWQYIDGDSEQYLQAGVISTVTSDYKFQGNLEAVVDVYTMKDPAGAKKIFETGQTSDAKPMQIGDAGIAYAQSIIFRKGNSLVRIVSYEATPTSAQALAALAHGVEANL
jgi:hypothetical protein